ncbi:hypothetical protein [Spiroplasma endosymbiont of Tipula paludosa]|uniref:hypothetical protein n=1 Tax=Spiroplasma endosymbiont of Tipula paludosa TaxID=3066295 RepID=UPI0035C93844
MQFYLLALTSIIQQINIASNIPIGLLMLLIVFGILVGILLITWFATWIYSSIIRNTNSANLTGKEFVDAYLKKFGFVGKKVQKTTSYEIKSQFFQLTPFHYKKQQPHHLIVKILPWTYHRSSLYTLAKAGEVAYSTSQGRKLFLSFGWSLIVNLALVVTSFLIINLVLLILNSQALFGNANPHQAIIVIGIVASICFILTISIPIYFYIWAMQPVYKFAQSLLTANEAKLIKWIYLVRILYLIFMTIYETLKTVAYVIVKIHEGT